MEQDDVVDFPTFGTKKFRSPARVLKVLSQHVRVLYITGPEAGTERKMEKKHMRLVEKSKRPKAEPGSHPVAIAVAEPERAESAPAQSEAELARAIFGSFNDGGEAGEEAQKVSEGDDEEEEDSDSDSDEGGEDNSGDEAVQEGATAIT